MMMNLNASRRQNSPYVHADFRRKEEEYIRLIRQLYEENKRLRQKIMDLQNRNENLSHRSRSKKSSCLHVSPQVSRPISPIRTINSPYPIQPNFTQKNSISIPLKFIPPKYTPQTSPISSPQNNNSMTSIALNPGQDSNVNVPERCSIEQSLAEMDYKIKKNNQKFNNQRNAMKTAPSDLGFSNPSIEKRECRRNVERRAQNMSYEKRGENNHQQKKPQNRNQELIPKVHEASRPQRRENPYDGSSTRINNQAQSQNPNSFRNKEPTVICNESNTFHKSSRGNDTLSIKRNITNKAYL